MARLTAQDPATATGGNKDVFDALQRSLGMVPNMARVMGNSPAVLQAYVQFSSALGKASLPGKVREQIALLVAEANECEYCLAAHSALGKMQGLSAGQIEGARRGASEDRRAQGALALARAVLESRGGVSGADLDAARGAGLSDGELAEVVATVALNVLSNYFNRAFAVEVDFPRAEPLGAGASR